MRDVIYYDGQGTRKILFFLSERRFNILYKSRKSVNM